MTDLSRLDSWRTVDVRNWLVKGAEEGTLSPIVEKHGYMVIDHRLDGRKILDMTESDFDRLRDSLEDDGLSRYSVGKLIEALEELRKRSARASSRTWNDKRNPRRGRRRSEHLEEQSIVNDRLSVRSSRYDRYSEDDRRSQLSHRSYRRRDDDLISQRSGQYSRFRDRGSDMSGAPYARSQVSALSELSGRLSVPRSRWTARSFANREDSSVRDLRTNVEDWKRVVERMDVEYKEEYQKLIMVLSGISRFYGDHADRRRTHHEYLKTGKSMRETFKEEKKWEEVERLDDVLSRLAKSKEILNKLRRLEKRNPSPILKVLIGDISVRCYRKGDLLGLKESYNQFQLSCVLGFFILPAPLLVTYTVQVNSLLQLFLIVYHAVTAIRMSILQQHGANILSTWIRQNYIAIAGAVVSILTPVSSPVTIFLQFIASLFYIGQGAVIFMRHVHLSKKLQAEVALKQDVLIAGGRGNGSPLEMTQYLPPRLLILMLAIGAITEILCSVIILGLACTGNILSILHGLLFCGLWLLRGVYNISILRPKAPDFNIIWLLQGVHSLVMFTLREVCNSVINYLWPKLKTQAPEEEVEESVASRVRRNDDRRTIY